MFSFFFNDTATTEIYTLSLHDALPISERPLQLAHDPLRHEQPAGAALRVGDPDPPPGLRLPLEGEGVPLVRRTLLGVEDRKSTRLNSSHANISYAVFCLKKKHTPYHRP